MAGKGIGCLAEAMGALRVSARPAALSKTFTRSMATEVSSSDAPAVPKSADTPQGILESWKPISTVPLTIHSFPSLEPTALEQWSVNHLYLPLRRDILHLAVVYEGDSHRQGTASTKTRWEVHGSHRKMAPQKGTGRARVGTNQSPVRRGGGVSHGPKPRDFATRLNRKVYDVAWRTALSYRYRRGELVVCEDGMELPLPRDFTVLLEAGPKYLEPELAAQYRRKWIEQVVGANGWGRDHGRTLFITGDRRQHLFDTMAEARVHGRALEVNDVDVKDLLEDGRVVVERSALREMIESHQSDLVSRVFVGGGPSVGAPLLS